MYSSRHPFILSGEELEIAFMTWRKRALIKFSFGFIVAGTTRVSCVVGEIKTVKGVLCHFSQQHQQQSERTFLFTIRDSFFFFSKNNYRYVFLRSLVFLFYMKFLDSRATECFSHVDWSRRVVWSTKSCIMFVANINNDNHSCF